MSPQVLHLSAGPDPCPPQPTPSAAAEGVWCEQLNDDAPQVAWLWHGYLAPGNVTLLTSQWKSGKTTLVSLLLARLHEGGQLAGLPLAPGKAVVLSEESRALWGQRHRKLGFRHVCFYCRPFRSKPSLDEWTALLDRVAALHHQHGLSLVVVDTLATFLPGRNEATAGVMMEALLPLQRLTQLGLSVLLLHHPRKGDSLPGQASRGSGALPAFVDILLEMTRCGRADDNNRRRRLLGFSRHEETPAQLVVELNAEGTDYRTVDNVPDDDFPENWERLRMVLEDADDKRTRRALLAEWPADFPRPSDTTLWRWLERATGLGLVYQEGSGRRADPFLYWLASKEAAWRADPVRELLRRMKVEAEALRPEPGLVHEGRPQATPAQPPNLFQQAARLLHEGLEAMPPHAVPAQEAGPQASREEPPGDA